jgi:NAD(P)-dependent dehydrogenase (short-subunit alcohol dehydrogenase family)
MGTWAGFSYAAGTDGAGWLQGKTVMVTGANRGLGYEAARRFAEQGARLYLVCRDRGRGEGAAREIRAQTGNRDVDVLAADLGSQAQIRRVADEFLATSEPLHVLCNNAGGVFGLRREVSEDGIEMTFALNHLAPFALTLLLLPRLRRHAPARVVNVASDAYKDAKGRFDFDDFNAETSYRPIRQYGRAKLASILFTRELARRLRGSGVTANAATPPRTSATGFAHNVHPLAKIAMKAAAPFLLAPRKAVAPIVHLCSSPEVDGMSGTYWSGLARPALTDAATNDDDARRLWELSEALTGVVWST